MNRLPEILAMLGTEATADDARAVLEIVDRTHPGVAIGDIPAATWAWVRTGEGNPPRVARIAPPSATSLMDIYVSLPDQLQRELLAAAHSLSAEVTLPLLRVA